MSRFVTIPETVVLKNAINGKAFQKDDGSQDDPWTMERYISSMVLSDPKMTKGGYKDVLAAIEITKAFANTKPGDVVQLGEDNWNRLKTAIDDPTNPLVATIATQLAPFMQAIMEASDKEPAALKEVA